jgi:protoheme IX farnesyltransferase
MGWKYFIIEPPYSFTEHYLKTVLVKLGLYWSLTKSLQTGLLLITGLAGFLSARSMVRHWYDFLGLIMSLFLAIAGSTILNMWYDRDLDAVMNRTHHRPLADGRLSSKEAFWVGLVLVILGVGISVALSSLYGMIVFCGVIFDAVLYTLWLKRWTSWSILWGGISGGMPILAGRVLAIGYIDWIGILLALAVLFWIPTHILTFAMSYSDDYQKANIPVFPTVYGTRFTRISIVVSSVLAALCISTAGILIGVQSGVARLLAVLSAGLLLLAAANVLHPTEKANFGLFKYASVFMLCAMILLSI